jgi:hypothetical protein
MSSFVLESIELLYFLTWMVWPLIFNTNMVYTQTKFLMRLLVTDEWLGTKRAYNSPLGARLLCSRSVQFSNISVRVIHQLRPRTLMRRHFTSRLFSVNQIPAADGKWKSA